MPIKINTLYILAFVLRIHKKKSLLFLLTIFYIAIFQQITPPLTGVMYFKKIKIHIDYFPLVPVIFIGYDDI